MGRIRVKVPCPGSPRNAVTLVATDWQAVYGISRPKNVGECALYLNWVDKDGDWGDQSVRLLPGEEIYSYKPDSGRAVKIKVAGNIHCYGEGLLEYDSPDS